MALGLQEPDSFSRDPYGYFTNQSGHTWDVGFLILVYGSCAFTYLTFGTFPDKEIIIIMSGILYLLFEVFVQGWKGWDTVEDWWFVNVYGVIAPVLCCTYNTTREMIEIEPLAPLPFIILYFTHKTIGAFVRSGLSCSQK